MRRPKKYPRVSEEEEHRLFRHTYSNQGDGKTAVSGSDRLLEHRLSYIPSLFISSTSSTIQWKMASINSFGDWARGHKLIPPGCKGGHGAFWCLPSHQPAQSSSLHMWLMADRSRKIPPVLAQRLLTEFVLGNFRRRLFLNVDIGGTKVRDRHLRFWVELGAIVSGMPKLHFRSFDIACYLEARGSLIYKHPIATLISHCKTLGATLSVCNIYWFPALCLIQQCYVVLVLVHQ